VPSMNKPTDADKEWFDSLLPTDSDVVRKPMFGQLAGFVNGNMFLCLFGSSVAVRLGEAERESLLEQPGATLFAPMPERPMKEYVVLPPEYREDDAGARAWVQRSVEFARSLPAKAPKSKAR